MVTAAISKTDKTIADYLSDLVAVESHIEKALDHQVNLTKDDATVGPLIQEFHDTVRDQREAAKVLQNPEGVTSGNPFKAIGSTITGKIAGLIDLVRTESISKALRDDYTAFNFAAISYSMFFTAASSFGDKPAADLAQKHLTSYAAMIQKINQAIAGVVLQELSKEGHPVEFTGTKETTAVIDRAWKSTSN